jgi:malate dehydrogenase (oxaloacetate-decarboxylating)(NADP+)
MQPVFALAQKAPKRVVYAEGEDERVLRAVQIVVDEGLAWPILVGRPLVVERRIQDYGLRLAPGRDFELVDPDADSRLPQAAQAYYQLTRLKGVTPLAAEFALRRNPTALAAMLVHRGEADALLCGMWGGFRSHLDVLADVIGLRQGVETLAAMNMLMLAERTLFICDTHVNYDPSPQQLAEIAVLAADGIRRFGVVPHAALLSHSSFGSEDTPSARKMRRALELIRSLKPRFEVEGEMHGDAALSKELLDQVHPGSALTRDANLLVMPTLDAANITFNVLKATAGHGITVGPILLGLARPTSSPPRPPSGAWSTCRRWLQWTAPRNGPAAPPPRCSRKSAPVLMSWRNAELRSNPYTDARQTIRRPWRHSGTSFRAPHAGNTNVLTKQGLSSESTHP